jgi:4-hydroxy-2-oxoheptanedioate aldolase
MRFNRFAPRRFDHPAYGIHLTFLCPELIEFCGALGFQWLFLDAEHGPLNPLLCRDLVRAADLADMFCVVRVPSIDAALIAGYLDLGVLGILAPDIQSAVQAQALVQAVKFPPQGARGAAHKSRAAHYGQAFTPAEYLLQANQATFTVALIESQAGIDHLDAIMAVPGIDYLAIGPNDLALSLGLKDSMADPRVREIVAAAQARMLAVGKPQISVAMNAEQGRASIVQGATLVAIPDIALLGGAGRAFLEGLNHP